jgi:hypothetical protein
MRLEDLWYRRWVADADGDRSTAEHPLGKSRPLPNVAASDKWTTSLDEQSPLKDESRTGHCRPVLPFSQSRL